MAKISVIMPTYRDSEAALQTAAAVCPQLGPGDELLIVDNGSEDAHREACEGYARQYPNVRIRVLVCTARGSYAARNLGGSQAQGDILAFTDSGCVPTADWLQAIRGHFAVHADSRVTGPIEMTYQSQPPSLVELVDARMHLNQDGYAAHGWAATANMAIRAAAFQALGGFHHKLQSGGDYEFGIRAMASGHGIGWCPAMVVQHEARATFGELMKKRRRVRAGHVQVAGLAEFPGLLERAMQASQNVRLQAEPRRYPPMSAVRWQMGRVALRLLREYERRSTRVG